MTLKLTWAGYFVCRDKGELVAHIDFDGAMWSRRESDWAWRNEEDRSGNLLISWEQGGNRL